MKQTNLILEEVLKNINPNENMDFIKKFLKEFIIKINSNIKKQKIIADIFVGGSFAKKTLIKKDKYDIDLFLRFDKKYPNSEISNMTKKLLGGIKGVKVVHGSRDYFSIKVKDNFIIEVVPVRKISKPSEAENITDLSYSHVRYINKNVKTEKILNDIKIAKAFCYASNCYGAESYIKGFSGYSLELLVYHYKGFMNFIKAVLKINPNEREIIDTEKLYKNKKEVLLDMNTSKLISPIILVDPTFKQRNALAALSKETLVKFQKHCAQFLKTPGVKSFEIKKVDLVKIKENAIKNKNEFLLLEISTEKQEGDVAGSKLYKFYNHMSSELERYFVIKNKGFNYNNKQKARIFFVLKKREFVFFNGPFVKDRKNVIKFKKEHKKVLEKNKRLFAKEKFNFNSKDFVKKWKLKNKSKVSQMYINEIKII
jgi:tRNA nucleotidyltransferase (CCA-adding enzyme)